MNALLAPLARALGWKRLRVKKHESALLWRDGDVDRLLGPGEHWYFDPAGRVRAEILSRREPLVQHAAMDLILQSGVLEGHATVLRVAAHERGLLWVDGLFTQVLWPGRWVFWSGPEAMRELRTEVVDTRVGEGRFVHPELEAIVPAQGSSTWFEVFTVTEEAAVLRFAEGRYAETLGPGRYVWWKDVGNQRFSPVDLREGTLDVAGQDLLTQDRVSVRLNAVVSYRVADALKSLTSAADARQALYRETQLALRAVVGARELDALLADREALSGELAGLVEGRAAAYGFAVTSAGVRDVILPGDMRELMNRITEAKKAAEAGVYQRREETAAMRHQLNTARLLAENPVLMRLRELETLEKVASKGKLRVMLGEGAREKGLAGTVAALV